MRTVSWMGLIAAMGCLRLSIVHADLADGLVGYYSFDDGVGEILDEQTGLGSDGELFNFEGDGSEWVEGQIGGALLFDGLDDYVIAPEAPLAETALSVSIWGFANNAPLWASLVKNWGQGAVGQFHFGLGPNNDDTLNIFITTGDGSAFNAGTDLDPIELETWEHYAFVANPDEENVSLYRNGELVDDRPYDGTFTEFPNSEAIGIGVKTTDAGDQADTGACCPGYWDGMLDDLGIWHRALTEAEITDIYTRGLSGNPIIGGNTIPGDFNGNGELDAEDIDLLSAEVLDGNDPAPFDLTGDGSVNQQDRMEWIEGLKNTYIGDSNLDGEFSSSDFVLVFQAGKFELDVAASWGDGDWNGDARFNTSDFVLAFQAGGFELGPRDPNQPVPEPSCAAMLLWALTGLALNRRYRS